MSVRRAAVALVVSLAMPAAVRAVQRPAPTDQQIQAEVARQLQDHHLRRRENPQVSVADGVVTLAGQVQSVWEKNESVKVALKVDGVHRLISDLVIARAESDKAIGDEISKRVLRYSRYTVFDDVNVGVRNGVVTMSGAVTEPFKADDLVDAASRVQGVQEVKNLFKTLPVSLSDDRIRSELAARIFRNVNLSVYGRGANPSIHIIVENGRVTLVGYVDTALDRQVADTLARETRGVFGVDNRLQVAR
jgi:hyperosmotically inducible protein